MTQFTGESEDAFSILAALGHFLIAIGIIATCVGLLANLFGVGIDFVGLLVGAGGGGVMAGIGLSFLNILLN